MIIYTYPVRTAFTDRDVEMIQTKFSIKTLEFTQNPVALPFFFILQFFQLVIFLPKTKYYLCFFGGYHSVLPTFLGKIFKRKVFIQCGGTDAVNMPEINYGNFRKKWLRLATVYSFKNCTKILPVADSLVRSEYHYDPLISSKQGLKNLIPDLKTPIQTIYNGFDTDFWIDFGKERKPMTFITVAKGISNPVRGRIKGIDLIELIALRFPQAEFTLVGDVDYKPTAKNISVTGPMDKDRLRELYNIHRYYLQLSTSEGFPNALAEAMLCGCVPIGSAVGDIPLIIDDSGFILDQKNPDRLTKIIQEVLNMDFEKKRSKSRNKILKDYPYSKRKKELLGLFN
ncbi:glycosyltransferase family 4 protein [Aquiflexum gelatinilyticum]|uniref:Glycosyltransferase family 4 protein n=1 Tax=Aquiflexum gelatinilyticum TaxID=2961943 RepID=A0A9X2SYU9_9BACT|nr:glycosyltransferase family 4 protein [Aquiflexum gelatinilyticum]MCR9015634.1 glycosyltransferase family 4 protein [Aquiflexum gelatinilyticum]